MDDSLNTGDASMVLRYAVGLVTLDEYRILLGDCNGDSRTDTGDAATILHIIIEDIAWSK